MACSSSIEGFDNRFTIDYEKDYQHVQSMTADPPADQAP